MPGQVLAQAVPVLRMAVTHEKKARMMIGFGARVTAIGLPTIAQAAMRRAKAEHKEGEAPQDHVERKIRECFEIGRDYIQVDA